MGGMGIMGIMGFAKVAGRKNANAGRQIWRGRAATP